MLFEIGAELPLKDHRSQYEGQRKYFAVIFILTFYFIYLFLSVVRKTTTNATELNVESLYTSFKRLAKLLDVIEAPETKRALLRKDVQPHPTSGPATLQR